MNADTVAECTAKIDTAQKCVDICVNEDPGDFMLGNKLVECTVSLNENSTNVAANLESCCEMSNSPDPYDADCDGSLIDADECLTGALEPVKTSSMAYMSCLAKNYRDGVCPWSSFCLGLLTDGYGTGGETDFGLGADMYLANKTQAADTCDDLDFFGNTTCTELKGCCPACVDKIADVVNAVVDNILIPVYAPDNSNLGVCAENKTCAYYTTGTTSRQLDLVVDADGGYVLTVEDQAYMTELTTECTNGINEDIIYLGNEMQAADNFMECMGKKTGKMMAHLDTEAQIEATASSSASLSAVSFVSTTAVVVAVMASTLF